MAGENEPTAGASAPHPGVVNPKVDHEEKAKNERTLNVPADFIAHTFPLRRDLVVTIPLPGDLTKGDVSRLHAWLGTLVFDDPVTAAPAAPVAPVTPKD